MSERKTFNSETRCALGYGRESMLNLNQLARRRENSERITKRIRGIRQEKSNSCKGFTCKHHRLRLPLQLLRKKREYEVRRVIARLMSMSQPYVKFRDVASAQQAYRWLTMESIVE